MRTSPTTRVIGLTDQTVLLAQQATGATNMIQGVWIYDRAIDLEGLRRFHHHLQHGALSRRIELSALPFGRHRWVAAADAPGIQMCAPAPRAELEAWIDEQANTPLDPVGGPGWHLGVLPLADGGTVVSLVATHCLIDGVGLIQAFADAASGRDNPLAMPAPGSRRRRRALREDALQTVRDLPAVGRALGAAMAMARRDRVPSKGAETAPRLADVADGQIALPTAATFIDIDEWDARAAALGGTSNALLAGLAADIGRRMGRVDPRNGTVALAIPVNDRTAEETRANAVSNVNVTVDPSPAPHDLREIRTAIKAALIRSNEVPDERWTLLPIIPLIPKRLFRRMLSTATGGSTAVISSNMGDADPAANRPDGTDADFFTMRSLYPGVSRQTMYRVGGVLALLSARIHGRVFISVLAYLPGQHNSHDRLRRSVLDALNAFSLASTAPWPTAVATDR